MRGLRVNLKHKTMKKLSILVILAVTILASCTKPTTSEVTYRMEVQEIGYKTLYGWSNGLKWVEGPDTYDTTFIADNVSNLGFEVISYNAADTDLIYTASIIINGQTVASKSVELIHTEGAESFYLTN